MTPKPKTITVKAVGVLVSVSGIGSGIVHAETYGGKSRSLSAGKWRNREVAKTRCEKTAEEWENSRIVDLTITVQLKKGKKP